MRLHSLASLLGARELTAGLANVDEREVSSGHVSDLLSDVLAFAPADCLLVTIQVHMNVLAVASHVGAAGVIFAADRTPEAAVIEKAQHEHMPLFVCSLSSFDIAGRLYLGGLRGARQ